MIERRNRARRALCGGLVLGALAALALGLVDGVHGLASAPGAFDNPREQAAFLLFATLLPTVAGALAGALLGLVVAAVSALLDALLSRSRQISWAARLYTALATPPIAVAAAQIFRGRRAQLIPGHDLLAVAAGLTALALFYLAVRAAIQTARGASTRSGPRAPLVAIALATSSLAAWAGDQFVLPRLYPFFHVALEALAFALALAAVGAGYLAALRRGSRIGRVAEPSKALALALVLVAGGAFALARLRRGETLRAAIYQHTALAARLLETARALGLAHDKAPPSSPPASPRSELAALPLGPTLPDADVVLITVDALRADRITARIAPRLFALAAGGVQFDHAYAQVPHTSFSLATLLTGKDVFSLAALGVDPGRHETLAEVFQRDRYKTAAFFPPSVFFIDAERFTEVEKARFHFEYVKFEYLDARGRTDQVIHFLEAERPPRVFVWAHYFEPHEPYDLHEGHQPDGHLPSTAEERYDGEVHYVDQEIGRLLDYLHAHRPHALIAIAADHGEEFGEHGGRYHGTSLYEEQVRVPLIFVGPGIVPRHVAAPVGLIDVAPTLLSLAGITPSAKLRGHDLGPWLAREGCAASLCGPRFGPAYAEIASRKLLALGDDRLICDLSRDFCELFDVGVDPGEQKNLAGQRPERAAELRARLIGWMNDQSTYERDPSDRTTSDGARQALERGRLGDRTVAGEVAGLLSDGKLRAEAAAVLLALPPDPALRGAINDALRVTPGDVLLRTLALRLGERSLALPLLAWAEGDHALPRVRAEIALGLAAFGPEFASRAVPLLARALSDPLTEDEERRIIEALGRSHDPRAAEPLLAHLDAVRTRRDVVHALGEIPAAVAAPRLAAAIVDEPYVPVREEMARVLRRLGDRHAAVPLARLLTVEKEPAVAFAVALALADLRGAAAAGGVDLHHVAGWSCDDRGCAPTRQTTLPVGRARAGETLWLVAGPDPRGAVEIEGQRLELRPDQRIYEVRLTVGKPRFKALGEAKLVATLPRGAPYTSGSTFAPPSP